MTLQFWRHWGVHLRRQDQDRQHPRSSPQHAFRTGKQWFIRFRLFENWKIEKIQIWKLNLRQSCINRWCQRFERSCSAKTRTVCTTTRRQSIPIHDILFVCVSHVDGWTNCAPFSPSLSDFFFFFFFFFSSSFFFFNFAA